MVFEQKSVKNAAVSVAIGGLLSRAIGFIGSIALARILVPEDYGYWVIVMMITSFFSLVIDAGFEYYYIVKVNINKGEETPQEEVVKIENTVFFLRVIVNLLLFVLQFGLSYLPIDLLSSPVDKIVRLLAFVHIINIMGRINEVRLKKYFNFGKITKFNIISSVVSTFVQVICAFLGFGVMSFAWGSLVKVLVNNIGLVSIGRFRPDLKQVSKPLLKDVLWFAFHSWSGNVGQYLQSQIDKFLLKNNYSMTDVGYYSFSNGHSSMISNYILSPLGSVVMNFISKHQNHPRRLEEFVSLYNNFLLIVILPLQVMLYVYAEQFIQFVYGDKWVPAILLFKLFLIKVIIDMFFEPYGFFLTAFGRVDYRAKLNWFAVGLYGISLFITTIISSSIVTYSVVFVLCTFVISCLKSFLSITVSRVNLKAIYKRIKTTLSISMIIFILMLLPTSYAMPLKVLITSIASILFISMIIRYDKHVILEIDDLLLGSKIKTIYSKYKK